MSQKSAIYSAARVRVLEKSLQKADDIRRLADTDDFDAAMRMLSEFGYTVENSSENEIDAVINAEMIRVRTLIFELTTDESVTNFFIMRNDMRNLKQLIKLKLQGEDITDAQLDATGVIEPKLMCLMVKQWEFSSLPKSISQGLVLLDTRLARERDSISPMVISACVDRLYFEYAQTIQNDFVREYARAECDFTNLLTLFRLKKLGADIKTFCEMLMPTGDIKREQLVAAYECETDEIAVKKLIEGTKTIIPIKQALSDISKLYLLEVCRDNYLMELARRGKWDMETILPVVAYYLAKQRECEVIRMILTLKRAKVSSEQINARLREVYYE